jgi:hypothetical protein
MIRNWLKPALWCVITLLTLARCLASCASHGDIPRGVARECADPDSEPCLHARIAFQQVQYTSISQDRLVAASTRALDDLNFETARDDEHAQVRGSYVEAAPTHKDQLDQRFHKFLRDHPDGHEAPALIAQVDVISSSAAPAAITVRLRLYNAQNPGSQTQVDEPALYEIFFKQLGFELAGTSAAVPAPSQPSPRKAAPPPQGI